MTPGFLKNTCTPILNPLVSPPGLDRVRDLILALMLTAGFYFAAPALAEESGQGPERLSLAAGICVNEAQILFQKGNIKEAIARLEDFLNQPGSLENTGADLHYIRFLLGNFYSSQAQVSSQEKSASLEKAAQYYRTALKEKPFFTAAWLNLAKCCYEAQNYADAALAFEKGYASAKTKTATHLYYAAVCHFQAGSSKKALARFHVILNEHPDKITLAWREILVNIMFSMGQYTEALPHIKELAQKTRPPKQKNWQEILLHQYLNLEMDVQALAFAEELTRSDPLEATWWKALSHIHLKNNTLDKGLSALIIYGFLTPMTPEELKLAADLYLTLEVPSKAAALYESALKQVYDPKILKKLTQAFAMAFDQENALKWIDKGLAESKDVGQPDPDLLTLKAQILYTRQSYEKAADAYAQVTQCAATPQAAADAWLMLGYAAMNGSQLDRADQAFKMAARHKNHKAQAEKAIARIKDMKAIAPL